MSGHRLFRGGLQLGLGQVVIQGATFVRTVLVARLITPEDFGIAATFALLAFFLEMVSNLAAETLLIQAEDGEDQRFQGATHLVQVARGVISAAVVLLVADPVSRLFGVPEARWAFQWVALVPLIKGFAHTDLYRLQRSMKFGPFIAVNIWATVSITVASVPLGLWLKDYRVMIWVILLQAAALTVSSHLVAERRYVWAWDAALVKRIFRFGWPLLINGLLMYLILQGDRLVIAVADQLFATSSYTLAELGAYSLAFSLTLTPTTLVANVVQSLCLPMLARAKGVAGRFERGYELSAQTVCLIGLSVCVPFILVGQWLLVTIYGSEYTAGAAVVGWLAAMQALRIARVAPTVAAMALGDTRSSVVANTVRTSAFVAVLVVASRGGELKWIAACGFAGELLGLAAAFAWLYKRHDIAPRRGIELTALTVLGLGLAGFAQQLGLADSGLPTASVTSLLVVLLVGGLMLVSYPGLRRELVRLLRGSMYDDALSGA